MANTRFIPTIDQVKNPELLLRVLRDLATQVYTMADQISALQAEVRQAKSEVTSRDKMKSSVLDGTATGAAALVKLGVDQTATAKSNLTATSNPTATDDSTKGYSIGSTWVNISTSNVYVAASVQPGAAVWRGPI